MKLLLSLAAVAALSGCAYYGDPYYGAAYPAGYGYANPGGVTIGVTGTTYGSGYGYGPGYSSGYGRGWRDRDGDGVPNRFDARPRDPRWR